MSAAEDILSQLRARRLANTDTAITTSITKELLREQPTMARFINQNPELKAEYEKFKTFEILNDKYGKR